MDQFEQIYRRHALAVRAYLAARLPHAEVDDAFQETWTRLWQHARVPQNPRAWLFRVARNLVCDFHRREKQDRKKQDRWAEQAQARGDPREPPEGEDLSDPWADWKAALRRCLALLPLRQREVVTLKCTGLSPRQIAQRLETTPNNVYQQWHQAKSRLKACIEQQSDGVPA